jgi:hypothetical protein
MTLESRARAFLASAWLLDQPVAVSRAAAELRHRLREPLTPETTRRLLDVLADEIVTHRRRMGDTNCDRAEVLTEAFVDAQEEMPE